METTYSFDKTTKWLHSGGKPHLCPPGGLGKALYDKIKEHAGKGLTCQIDAETGLEECYKSFFAKCIKIAQYMRDQGLKSGDIISMCSLNNANNFAVLIAAYFNGIILASTDPLISVTDSKYLLGLVEPKLMFVCEKSFEISVEAIDGQGIKIVTLYGHDSLDNVPDILKKYNEEDIKSFVPHYIEDLKKTISIQFSSGTTGMPKATCLDHCHMFENSNLEMAPGSRCTIFTTLYWGTTIALDLSLIMIGGTRVYIRDVTAQTTWDYLRRSKCNKVFFSYGFCIQCLPYLKDPMPDLKVIMMSGGLLSTCYHNELKEKLPHVKLQKIYGATELGIVSCNDEQCPPESAGVIASKDIILKIVDIETEKAVDLKEIGEIRVKGNYLLTGYYKRDSTDSWDAEGFYKTGDVGYLNEKFELFVVDRIKEMFKYRGYHLIPIKIEKVLLTHPAVKQALVIPVRHLTDDSHAKGLVVLKNGWSANPDELVKFTNDKIDDPRDHLRAGVQFIKEEDITYTATRKINRQLLKQKFNN